MTELNQVDVQIAYLISRFQIVLIQIIIIKFNCLPRLKMNPYYQTFARSKKDPRVVSNRHFLNPASTSQINQQVNRTDADLVQKIDRRSKKNLTPIKSLQEDYKPAKMQKALQYKKQRSYYVKSSEGNYRQMDLFQEVKGLKYFGLGPYFYVEFMRRICWLYLLFSLLEGVRIYINARSGGLSGYNISFSTYLIRSTLGNFSYNSISNIDAYIVVLVPAAILLLFFLFYICWKCHFFFEINEAEENNLNVKPEKFCVEVQLEQDNQSMTEEGLKKVFQNFGPVHQVSLIRRHKNKLQYFQQLQNKEEAIKEVELQLKLEGGSDQEFSSLKRERDDLLKEIRDVKINPKTISAYIHFQFQKSKIECLQFFDNHYLFDACSHNAMRSCCGCCLDGLAQKFKLNSKSTLLIKNQEVPSPEDINWESFQLNCTNQFCRYIFAAFIIIVFLAFSCTIIGICTIYVSAHSTNCDSVSVPTTLSAAQASTDQTAINCYCSSNLLSSLTDASIKSFCSSQLTGLYIEQAIQFVIIGASAVTNFLFGLVVDKIINCTRPTSQSSSLKFKTLIYTIFLIFNTIFLPILLFSDIFGFKTSSYFSFLTLISSGVSSFFSVDSLQFYVDYSPIWYKNVSPIFTNYLILDVVTVWLVFLYQKYKAGYSFLSSLEGKILQKHMNKQITGYQFSPYKEYSSFIMIIFMSTFLTAGIPVLMPLAFIDLLSRYICNRSLMQSSSTRVDGLGIVFNYLPHNIIPILLILSTINAAWFLTANSSIYPSVLNFNLSLGSLNNWGMLQRQLYLPFYIILGIVALCEFLIYRIVAICCGICGCCSEKKRALHPSHTKPFSEHKKSMNILTSYNIKSNDKMRNAVTRMELYIQK